MPELPGVEAVKETRIRARSGRHCPDLAVRLELVEAELERYCERQRCAVCELRVDDAVPELLPDGLFGSVAQAPRERRRFDPVAPTLAREREGRRGAAVR